ncbi:hypothetical protein JHK82_048372 [Glycine max]|uniref:Uncharacterized protein n=2 Tax=Glycine subgen. Soja TaxID=1462606 RepID=K7MN28_SOYBN|nr:hypothetical protein JHK86_048244 [Glycine max]KAG4934034.1 hypothetical protein JHK87_048036 [Glycine soja]KAG4944228.1 hypothetical protein JHK85_048874 [Glycine max]KAG5098518.1 hypothetical protein JHK82_048372 [Glycine max]KAG5103305.1 hypothetical protein JHK84_048274 [Glycine max]
MSNPINLGSRYPILGLWGYVGDSASTSDTTKIDHIRDMINWGKIERPRLWLVWHDYGNQSR